MDSTNFLTTRQKGSFEDKLECKQKDAQFSGHSSHKIDQHCRVNLKDLSCAINPNTGGLCTATLYLDLSCPVLLTQKAIILVGSIQLFKDTLSSVYMQSTHHIHPLLSIQQTSFLLAYLPQISESRGTKKLEE